MFYKYSQKDHSELNRKAEEAWSLINNSYESSPSASAAIEFFKAGCKDKNNKCIMYLAYCYKNGFGGLEINPKKELELYEDAYKNGLVSAANNIAFHYLGSITEKNSKHNLQKAHDMFYIASVAGHMRARYNLAWCFQDGIYVPKNLTFALRYLFEILKIEKEDAQLIEMTKAKIQVIEHEMVVEKARSYEFRGDILQHMISDVEKLLLTSFAKNFKVEDLPLLETLKNEKLLFEKVALFEECIKALGYDFPEEKKLGIKVQITYEILADLLRTNKQESLQSNSRS